MTGDVTRKQYRELSEQEKADIMRLKAKADALLDELVLHGSSREMALAKTKVEEAVMWAVKGLTSA